MRGSRPHKKDVTHYEITKFVNKYNKLLDEKLKHRLSKTQYDLMKICIFDTHVIGNGFPDLIVSIGGINILVEVKTGKGILTEKERKFSESWTGCLIVANSVEDFFEQILKTVAIASKETFTTSIYALDIKQIIDYTLSENYDD